MGKYIVRVYLSSFYDVEVDARNEDEAKEIAEDCEYWDSVEPENTFVQEEETEILKGPEPIIVEVDWDTVGEDADLDRFVKVPSDISAEDISDWLSDTYGYCVNSWAYYMGRAEDDKDETIETVKIRVEWDVDDEPADELPYVIDIPRTITALEIPEWIYEKYGYTIHHWEYLYKESGDE